jgi:PAS domain S-box-containing protein
MKLSEADILGASILIVDDERNNVELLKGMLVDVGYRNVSSTTNPRKAGPLHQENNYDLILLDLHMPGMDGFEVMEQLKDIEQSGYLPVLVLTAQHSSKLRALRAGARDFVSKPFEMLEIQTRIHNMIEVRLLHKRIEGDNRELEQTVLQRTADLRESEARFRSLVELASDWYWEQDEHGHFTKVSGPALEMLGLGDPDTTPGKTPMHWNQQERAALDEKLAARLPFLDFVYSRTTADGTEQFLQASGEPMFDASSRFIGYRGIGMDVTARVVASRGSYALNRVQLQRIDGSVLSMDVRQHASDGELGWVFVEVAAAPERAG